MNRKLPSLINCLKRAKETFDELMTHSVFFSLIVYFIIMIGGFIVPILILYVIIFGIVKLVSIIGVDLAIASLLSLLIIIIFLSFLRLFLRLCKGTEK